jgi:DNA primase
MSDIDEIKARINIADVIGKHVTLKKAGRNFKALCPFHSEKTPSFIVSPERQMFKCFGCGKGGSVIDFVMEYEHVDFVEALESLADMAGVKLERRPADSPEAKLKQKIYEANHLASEYYRFILTKHASGDRARRYLKKRGVTDKIIETFALGYAPHSWDNLHTYLRKKGYDEGLLEQAGLVIRRQETGDRGQGFYDRFRGRIMFTLKDHRGNVVGFSGRLLDPDGKDLPAGRQEAKYINTSETPVYIKSNVLYGLDITKEAIKKAEEAIIVEGEFDVISPFQEGVANVVAIKGSALTDGHVRLLKRFTDRLVFALDSDIAGDTASRRGIEIADAAGMDMRVVTLPEGKDPDDAVRANAGNFKKAVKEAVPVYDYFIASAKSRFDIATSYGKRKASDELLPVLAKIENPVVQAHYVKKLAEALDVSETSVTDGMRKATGVTSKRADTDEAPKKNLSRPEKLETYVLALILQGKTAEWLEELREHVAAGDFAQPAVRTIFSHLETFVRGKRVFLLKDFADSLPQELTPTLDDAYLWDMSELADDEETFVREWTVALKELRRAILKRKMREFNRQIGESARKAGNESERTIARLQKELKDCSLLLAGLDKSG